MVGLRRGRGPAGARVAILVILLVALALPARGDAFIYWTNTEQFVPPGGGSIGRAGLDGSDVEPSFLNVDAQWIAVDAQHLYWTDPDSGSIGRANLDGSDVLPNFIPRVGTPTGIAVDGSFVYWGNVAADSIGRARLDGTDVEPDLVAGADGPQGVAVDAGHIYWANGGTSPGGGTSIGRANLDGSGADQSFITGAREPTGLALDGEHLYWGTPFFILNDYGFVGRANLDGGEVTQLVTGAIRPLGVAVDSLPHPTTTAVDCAPATITLPATTTCTATVSDTAAAGAAPPTGEVGFSSSGAGSFGAGAGCGLVATGGAQSSCQLAFTPSEAGAQTVFADYAGATSHAASHGSVALSALAPAPAKPSNAFRLSTPRLHRRKGTATLIATLPGPGKLVLRGNRVHGQAKAPKAGGKVKLPVEPKRRIRSRLKRAGRAEVAPTVTYTPSGGDPRKKSKRVGLRLKR